MPARYPTRKVNGKKDRIHRHVMEASLGRLLLPEEHVYHKNGDGYDNSLENLVIIIRNGKKKNAPSN